MKRYVRKKLIEWNAENGYEYSDIFPLIQLALSSPSILLFRNSHLITTKAFNALYKLMEEEKSTFILILKSSEPEKVHPELLQYVVI